MAGAAVEPLMTKEGKLTFWGETQLRHGFQRTLGIAPPEINLAWENGVWKVKATKEFPGATLRVCANGWCGLVHMKKENGEEYGLDVGFCFCSSPGKGEGMVVGLGVRHKEGKKEDEKERPAWVAFIMPFLSWWA